MPIDEVLELWWGIAVLSGPSRSPFELLAVIAEFTGRRIIMTGKYSKELAAFWRVDAFRELRQPG